MRNTRESGGCIVISIWQIWATYPCLIPKDVLRHFDPRPVGPGGTNPQNASRVSNRADSRCQDLATDYQDSFSPVPVQIRSTSPKCAHPISNGVDRVGVNGFKLQPRL